MPCPLIFPLELFCLEDVTVHETSLGMSPYIFLLDWGLLIKEASQSIKVLMTEKTQKVIRQDRTSLLPGGGASVRNKSRRGSGKYQTCLIFYDSLQQAWKLQPTLTAYANIAPGPRKVLRYR